MILWEIRFIGVNITNLQQIVSVFELYRKLLGGNAPLLFKFIKSHLASIFRHRTIYWLKILHELLLIFAAHILHRVAYLMDDTKLHEEFCKSIQKQSQRKGVYITTEEKTSWRCRLAIGTG